MGLFSGFVTIGRYGKWYQPTALRDAAMHASRSACVVLSTHSTHACTSRHVYALAGIAIATMMSLHHRPLAEVCTVPVLLVHDLFLSSVLDVKDSLYLFYSQSPIVTSV